MMKGVEFVLGLDLFEQAVALLGLEDRKHHWAVARITDGFGMALGHIAVHVDLAVPDRPVERVVVPREEVAREQKRRIGGFDKAV